MNLKQSLKANVRSSLVLSKVVAAPVVFVVVGEMQLTLFSSFGKNKRDLVSRRGC
jgi:hypothetical protein